MSAEIDLLQCTRLPSGAGSAAIAGFVRPIFASASAATWDSRSDVELANEQGEFRKRLQADAAELVRLRAALRSEKASFPIVRELQTAAPRLGAAGLFGFEEVSSVASASEEPPVRWRCGRQTPEGIERGLGALFENVACA